MAAIVDAQIEQAKAGNTAAFKATVEWVEPALPKEIKVTTDFADKVDAVVQLSTEFITKEDFPRWHKELMSILRPSLNEAISSASILTEDQS